MHNDQSTVKGHVELVTCHLSWLLRSIAAVLKPGFHFLGSRPELTARELWCIFFAFCSGNRALV